MRYLLIILTSLFLCFSTSAFSDDSNTAKNPGEDTNKSQVTSNVDPALKELTAKAEAGDRKAQYDLGLKYDHGEGVPQDYKEAAKWYLKAAQQGDVRAQYNMGDMYYHGEGVTQDYGQAMKWFLKAAEQDDGDAQCSLGALYYKGEGVPQDDVKAYMWFSLSASHEKIDEDMNKEMSKPEAARLLREYIEETMTPEQIAEAKKLVEEWLAKHPKEK
jgi:TPR repeat protein